MLDEPTTGVDPASRKGLWNILGDMKADQGTAIVLTSHMNESLNCCPLNAVLCLSDCENSVFVTILFIASDM